MSGQRKSYKEMLKNTPYTKVSSEIFQVNIDYHGLREYADSKGVAVSQLTDEEKDKFIVNSNMNAIRAMA